MRERVEIEECRVKIMEQIHFIILLAAASCIRNTETVDSPYLHSSLFTLHSSLSNLTEKQQFSVFYFRKNPIYSSKRLNSISPEQTGRTASVFPMGVWVYRSAARVSTRAGITS